jgi:hypothetical protein
MTPTETEKLKLERLINMVLARFILPTPGRAEIAEQIASVIVSRHAPAGMREALEKITALEVDWKTGPAENLARAQSIAEAALSASSAAIPSPAALRTLEWIRDQRWNENADLDDICARAEAALSASSAPEPSPDALREAAIAVAIAQGCGLTFDGQRTLCTDPRASPDIRADECSCRLSAQAVLTAIASSPSNEWIMVTKECPLPDDMKPGDEVKARYGRGCLITYAYRRSGAA